MRRYLSMLFILILLACRAVTSAPDGEQPTVTLAPTHLSTVTKERTPQAIIPPSITPTLTPSPVPSSTAAPLPPPLFSPTPLSPTQYSVRFHPDGDLYVGDWVSVEVIDQADTRPQEARVSIDIRPPGEEDIIPLGPTNFGDFGIAGRSQATLIWAWDTRSLEAGKYTLTFSIQPTSDVWTETVTLRPASENPFPGAEWATAYSRCCVLHYITGAAAGRDIDLLSDLADRQAMDAVERLGIEFTEPITVTLLPRVLGHGGFAGGEISISYLDRNYAGSQFEMVLHHEMIHILDGRLGGDLRPTLFVEGLAVYLTGGHFKPEPLMPRAAALLNVEGGLDWYIPLGELADNFYPSQHEIGYLEGAALIEYMVDTWGWPAFSEFYRDIHPADDGSQASAIDRALREHFNLTFDDLEQGFIRALGAQPVDPDLREDMRLTVAYYDALRRYQRLLDASAYFRAAWLMDNPLMRQRGIVADYLRHPQAPANQALEALLLTANDALVAGRYAEADATLDVVNLVLDGVEQGQPAPFASHPLAADYLAIVQHLHTNGYITQRLTVQGDQASAWVSAPGDTALLELSLLRSGDGWLVAVQFSFDVGMLSPASAAAWGAP